jgi:allantoin racemase
MATGRPEDATIRRILWINPVGTTAFDADAEALIEAIRSPGHRATVRSLPSGPPHLEYHTYEHEAAGPMLELLAEADADGYDAAIIGCFYDGGLREARELCRMPIVGMAEPALAYAATLGHRFSVIVGRRKWIPKMTDNALLYGHERRLASMRSVEMGIPEVAADPDGFFDACIREARLAVERDGAEVVVLSEIAGPAFWERCARELDFPLIDPGAVCWAWAEMAADLYRGAFYSTSKVGGYESPSPLRIGRLSAPKA